MWFVVHYDCDRPVETRQIIDETGVPNRYGKPKLFKTKKDAKAWVERKSYWGMTSRYVIMKKIEIGTNIKGRIVEKIRIGGLYEVADKIDGHKSILHEIPTYESRKEFLVLDWEGHLFEIREEM